MGFNSGFKGLMSC